MSPAHPAPSVPPRPRGLLTLLLPLLVVMGCGGDADAWSGPVVDPVDVPVHPEAHLLPGVFSVRDARHDGERWWILDARNAQVVALDEGLRPKRAFGRRGEGPGELRFPAHLLFLEGGIAVLDNPLQPRVVTFGEDGEAVDEVQLHVDDCQRLHLVDVRETSRGVDFLAQCVDLAALRRPGRILPHFVVGVWTWDPARDDRVRPAWTRRRGVRAGLAIDDEPVGAVGPDATWVGTTGTRCLEGVGPRGERIRDARCLPELPRIPIPPERRADLARLAETLPFGSGTLVPVPELQPALDRVSLAGDDLVLHGIAGEEARTLHWLEAGGQFHTLEGPVPLDTFVDGGRVLMTWQVTEGTMVRQASMP